MSGEGIEIVYLSNYSKFFWLRKPSEELDVGVFTRAKGLFLEIVVGHFHIFFSVKCSRLTVTLHVGVFSCWRS